MGLQAGARCGAYEILAPLGAGGMGEVYRARDTRLGRDVAIKVLPSGFAPGSDHLARFRREAQLLAALNHTNIAAIYGLEETDGALALVMELVDGPTLAGRISQGPVPLAEALPIARQIAEALEYAHERGIIHRDLKPANIKVTAEGKVKVLDFGLAKAVEDAPEAAAIANSPTLSMAATKAGIILGTAAYMPPEQAKGKAVDRRADIWAFGVVLFEMLTGRQLYGGETASETLASVIKDTPAWDRLPAETPGPIQKLLRRCLEKDPTRRLRDIGEARIAIDEYLADPAGASAIISAPSAAARPARWAALPWIAAGALFLALLLALAGWWRATRPVSAPLVRLNVDLGSEAALDSLLVPSSVSLSPDGSRVVFRSRGPDGKIRLATRPLDQPQATPLAGTENAVSFFFSPDGQWIGFFSDDKLRKVSVLGGAAVALCDAREERGGSWGEDGTVVFATSRGGLSRIAEAGGAPAALTQLSKGEVTHRWPQLLPGAQAVLFTANTSRGNFDDAYVDVVSLKSGRRKTLHRGGAYGRYVPSGPHSAGHLLYLQQGTLFAARMDLDRLELTGPPAPAIEGVAWNPNSGAAQFDFSRKGMFLYVSGQESRQWSIMWLDSSGKIQPLRTAAGRYYSPRISPDGKRLALGVQDGGNVDVWVYEWARDTMARLTFSPDSEASPVWTPDGKRIAFTSTAGGGAGNIYWVRSDGAGQIERLTESPNRQYPYAFSPDGKRLAYSEASAEAGQDLWTLPLEAGKPGKPELFLRTPAVEIHPAFSPDGRWIAYTSNESGNFEIYVRPFPGPGGKWQISSGGGWFPIWSRSGRELFYKTSDERIMVAAYTAQGGSFVAGKPRAWTDKRLLNIGPFPNMDVAPDGKRFAVFISPEASGEQKAPTQAVFLLNFFDELRRRVPPGK